MTGRLPAFLLLSLISGGLAAADVPAQQQLDQQEQTRVCEAKIAGRMNRDDPDWGHMHHYCYALGFQSKALKSMARPVELRSNVEQAVDNFNYVLNHTTQKFAMRPEVLIEKGRTLQLVKKTGEATACFAEALKLNPSLPMAYVSLADQFSDNGNKAAAMQIVKDGLMHVPDSPALRRRYLQLGGKEPFPRPASAPSGTEQQPAKQ